MKEAIDNLEKILPLLTFKQEGDFYVLNIFSRKKDKNTDKSNHQSVRTIKTYTITSQEYLLDRYEEIKKLCDFFDARAYIGVNRLNNHTVALKMIEKLVHCLQNNNKNVKGVYDSVVGSLASEDKRWVVDIDDIKLKDTIYEIIANCKPFEDKILCELPSKKGIHLITKPFDSFQFSKACSALKITENQVFIQKLNPTNLYIGKSLMNL